MIGLAGRLPWMAGGAALLIATHGLAYHGGRSDGAASTQARYARAQDKALEAMRRGEAAIDHLNGLQARAITRQEVENRSIHEAAIPLLPRAVHSTLCIDADGVGLLDRARANANLTADTGEPARAATRPSGDAAR